MVNDLTPDEASSALARIDRSRRRVIGEIDMPRWYWIGLACGWIALGAVTDLERPLATFVATLGFGAVHSSVYHLVAGGRRRTAGASIRSDVAGRNTPLIIGLCLVALAVVTVVGAWAASADGARHPVTTVSCFVAVLIVLGGPRVMSAIRSRAYRTSLPL